MTAPAVTIATPAAARLQYHACAILRLLHHHQLGAPTRATTPQTVCARTAGPMRCLTRNMGTMEVSEVTMEVPAPSTRGACWEATAPIAVQHRLRRRRRSCRHHRCQPRHRSHPRQMLPDSWPWQIHTCSWRLVSVSGPSPPVSIVSWLPASCFRSSMPQQQSNPLACRSPRRFATSPRRATCSTSTMASTTAATRAIARAPYRACVVLRLHLRQPRQPH